MALYIGYGGEPDESSVQKKYEIKMAMDTMGKVVQATVQSHQATWISGSAFDYNFTRYFRTKTYQFKEMSLSFRWDVSTKRDWSNRIQTNK